LFRIEDVCFQWTSYSGAVETVAPDKKQNGHLDRSVAQWRDLRFPLSPH
jgi:hypothetical protein